MLTKVCQNCQSIVELDESDYQPGESVSVECQLCGESVVFTIPEKTVEKVAEIQPKKIEEQSRTVRVSDANVRRRNQDNQSAVDENTHRESLGETSTVSDAVIGSNPSSDGDSTPIAVSPFTKPSTPITPPIEEPKGNSNKKLLWIIIVLGLVLCGIAGVLYYNGVYIPEKIDREAPRYFTLASPSLTLRSTPEKDVEYNKVTSLPFGTKLIVYEIDGQWAKVKVDNSAGEKKMGYVSSDFILTPEDFKILNSIYGNKEAREIIESARTKKALLKYFKDNNYIGKISTAELAEAGINIEPSADNQWQVFCDKSGSKLNNVKFQRLINPSSKYQDMGVIIENIVTGDHKLLYFYFDDLDETPHFYDEMYVPNNVKLKSIVSRADGLYPQFE